MEKIVRKRVFYLGIGSEDERMRAIARRFEGRYYRALQTSHGWSFPLARLSEVREALSSPEEVPAVDTDGATQTEDDEPIRVADGTLRTEKEDDGPIRAADGATQTEDDEPIRAADGATQTDDKPVYRYDVDPDLERWIRGRYLRK